MARIPWAYPALVLCTVVVLCANVYEYVSTLPLLEETFYADAYRLYDAREYARTNHLYRAPTEAPYNPSVYSPLFYLVVSLPFRLSSEPSNPFLAPRLIVGSFFALCVALTASLSYALTRHRSVLLWSVLLALSVLLFNEWISQVRADFMGAAFGLAAARLLLSRSRRAPLLAGLAAGAAFAFKLTFVAAASSGFAWLLLSRRYRHCAEFAAGAALTGAGGYLVFLPFEPHMTAHLFALGTSIRDYTGGAKFLYGVAREPVSLLALSALPDALRRLGRRRQLLLLYGATSLLVAAAAALQPGAATNYFIEPLFLAVPLASVAALRLFTARARAQPLHVLLAVLLLMFFAKPALSLVRFSISTDVAARNQRWRALAPLLKDETLFSGVPDLTLLARMPPPMTEPFLIRHLELLGRYDTGPLAQRIRAGEFELVATRYQRSKAYRGVEFLSPAFGTAIEGAYVPFCVLGRTLFHLRRNDGDARALREGLLAAGCTPTAEGASSAPLTPPRASPAAGRRSARTGG